MGFDYKKVEKAWFKPKNTVLEELEEWIEEQIDEINLKGCSYEQTYTTGKWFAYINISKKIQELKKECR